MPSTKAVIAVACVSLIGLEGCVPWRYGYERIEVPQAQHLKISCGGTAGPPDMVYYPFHGIFISFDTDRLMLGLHVPEGTTVQLTGDSLVISGATQMKVRIEGDSRAPQVGGKFDPLPIASQLRLPASFEPLQGATRQGRSAWFGFSVSQDDHDRVIDILGWGGLDSGTIKLPPMTINGVKYEEQTLPFKHAGYFDLFNPVNC